MKRDLQGLAVVHSLESGSTRRRIASPGDQAVQDFGQALFDALITNDIRSCYEVSRLQAEQQGKDQICCSTC